MQEYEWQFKYKHFKPREFECPCEDCKGLKTGLKMDSEFMTSIEHARIQAGVPFVVGSGYRCKKHNKAIGGAKDSEHAKGLAGDISFKNLRQAFRIVYGLVQAEFTRIKIYKYKSQKRGWIHADKSKSKSKPDEWFTIEEV